MNRAVKFIAYAVAFALLFIPVAYLTVGLIYFGLLVVTDGEH